MRRKKIEEENVCERKKNIYIYIYVRTPYMPLTQFRLENEKMKKEEEKLWNKNYNLKIVEKNKKKNMLEHLIYLSRILRLENEKEKIINRKQMWEK